MPTSEIALTNLKQRGVEDAKRLEELRSAAKVGVVDFDQGRYSTFELGSELRSHLASVATKAIAEA